MRRAATVMLVLLLGILLMLAFQPRPVSEPVYKGKKLGEWLDSADWNKTIEVMQELGTNAVPWLLHEASAHENFKVERIKENLRNAFPVKFHFITATEHRERAGHGLRALGTAGVLALTQGLTNSDRWIRFGCIGQWEVGQKFPESYIPALLNCLNDQEPIIRASAANALCNINTLSDVQVQPEKAIPALIKMLDDTDEDVRCMAAAGLGSYKTNAKVAVPVLLKHLSNSDPQFKFWATNALKDIGPVAGK